MALLHLDGFDGKTSQFVGAYSGSHQYNYGNTYVTGRFGTGSAMFGYAQNGGQNEYRITFPTAKSVIYTGVAVKNGIGYSLTNGAGALLGFYSGNNCVLSYRINPTNFGPANYSRFVRGVSSHSDTGTVIATSADLPSGWVFIETKISCGTGTSGSLILRQNGIETINVTGVDTGSASLTGMSLRQGLSVSSAANSGWDCTVDDWWVCDDTGTVNNNFLGDLRIVNMVPAGAGASTQLVPSTGQNWMCLDEIPPSTADFVSSATPGEKDLYVKGPLAATDLNIRGAMVKSYASASDAGSIKGRSLCKSGATTGNGPDYTMTASPSVYSDLYEKDPNTSALWTNANFNAAEFGWEVRP